MEYLIEIDNGFWITDDKHEAIEAFQQGATVIWITQQLLLVDVPNDIEVTWQKIPIWKVEEK
jgi:hypothetical protein